MIKGFAGKRTSTGEAFAANSMVLTKSSAPFGVVLVSKDDGLCRLPDKADALTKGATTGYSAYGILLKHEGDGMPCTQALKTPIGDGELTYAKEGQALSLMRTGTCFVKVETDVSLNDDVFYRVEGGLLGSIRNDSDGGKALKLNGAVFLGTATDGETVEVSVNLNTKQEVISA